MKPENRKIFEDNKIHWETLTKAGYLKHLSGRERSDMMRAMSEEFQPGYTADLWCPTCVANMITQIYRRYFEFIEREEKEKSAQIAAEPSSPVVEAKPDTVPEPEAAPEPIQVAASFPVNDPPAAKIVPRKPNHRR